MAKKKLRTERDALGSMKLHADTPWGIYTERVLENYPQSDQDRVPEAFLRSYIKTKIAYARLNATHGKISKEVRQAIVDAGHRLLRYQSSSFMEYFPIGKIQSGGGTSTNMMVNEVLANQACKELGKKYGDDIVNSHDHVNASQSSNDTFPGVTKLTLIQLLLGLQKELLLLHSIFSKKAKQYADINKVGRTHLQDAVVIQLGNEFAGYARTIEKNSRYLVQSIEVLKEVNFGGTATGSMQNITPKMRKEIVQKIGKEFRLKLRAPKMYFEQNSSSGDIAYAGNMLSHMANDLIKICNDLRLLSSGPLAGINEISLPEVQPGSSIMPGKVNPSIPEALTMICAKVIGNTKSVNILTRQAQLELQQFMPGIARAMIESIQDLTQGLHMFRNKCARGIKPNKKRIKELLEGSFATATNYSEELGYSVVAKLVQQAMKGNKKLSELVEEQRGINARRRKRSKK